MQLSLEVVGPSSVAETTQLRQWLHDARLKHIDQITQETVPPKVGEQGPELLALLTVILAAPAVVELARSLHHYITARTPKITIRVKVGSHSIEIICTNPPPIDELVKQAKSLLE